jgi:hypothetical protein
MEMSKIMPEVSNDPKWMLLQLLACSYMTGVILLIHFIHYPAFQLVRDEEFKAFSKMHAKRITWIVFPPMVLELGLSIFLYSRERSIMNSSLLLANILIWGITGLKSAPTHDRLSYGFDHGAYLDLMRWNRARVWLWCFRLVVISLAIGIGSKGV